MEFLEPIAMDFAKKIAMKLVSKVGKNLTGGKRKIKKGGKLKGGDFDYVKLLEDMSGYTIAKDLIGEGKTRKKRTRKLKGGDGDFWEKTGDYLAKPWVDTYHGLKNVSEGKTLNGQGRSGAGKSGGAKKTSPWIERVKEYRKKHGCSYKEALIKLGKSNKK